METRPGFDVTADGGAAIGTTLLVGQSHLGMAGVTAADYLVRHLEADEIGHIDPEGLPGIAPFEDGIPRHHSRLYSLPEADLTVLVGELFIPVPAAGAYTDALLEWIEGNPVDEILVLHGVPYPHAPNEHEVFHVATPDYRSRRHPQERFPPLKGGVLDGVVGEIVTRNLDDAAPATGVLITPTHPPGPDVEATLKLLNAVESLYGFEVDETELRELGERLHRYYEQLADRMASRPEGDDGTGGYEYPEDRMYM